VFVFETNSPIYSSAPGQFNNASGYEQVYRYVVSSGELDCISCGPAGLAHAGDANLSNDAQQVDVSGHVLTDSRGISSDARRVFFDSPDALVPQAANGERNVYEWEAAGDGSCPASTVGGCLFLISTGQSTDASFFLDNSTSGNDVFFATTQGLVPQDTDGIYDIYDARVGGGFATPPASTCTGDSCQGTPSAPPAAPTAATITYSGPGNEAPAASPGKVTVSTHTVRGSTFLVRVQVPGKGRITISGAGIKRVSDLMRRAGPYAVKVTLTAKARGQLARKHKLRLAVRVSYTPTGGGSQSASLRLTVMPAARHGQRHGVAAKSEPATARR